MHAFTDSKIKESKLSKVSHSTYNQSRAFNSTQVSGSFQTAANSLIQNSLVTILQKKAEEMAQLADQEVAKRQRADVLVQQKS